MSDIVLAGIFTAFGAFIGYALGWRGFLREQRYRELQRKRDALRDFLGRPRLHMVKFISDSYKHGIDTDKGIELNAEVMILQLEFPTDTHITETCTKITDVILMTPKQGSAAIAHAEVNELNSILHRVLMEFETKFLRESTWWQFWK